MDDYYTRQMALMQKEHWWYEGRRWILADIIKYLPLPKNAKILEAGCGPGANITMLQAFGSVNAFDPDNFSVQNAKSISDARISTGLLPDGIPFNEKYNLVCAFDVIEHIDDDQGSLKSLFDVTENGGYAVFTVPAFMFLWSNHDEINYHKRRYRKNEFKNLLIKAGYEVKFISYYNFWLFPAVAAIRILKNILRIKDKDGDVKMPNKFLNQILFKLFLSEKFLLKKITLPFGISIVAVCEKK